MTQRMTRKPRLFGRRRLACLLALAGAAGDTSATAAAMCRADGADAPWPTAAPGTRGPNRLGVLIATALLGAALMPRRDADSRPGA